MIVAKVQGIRYTVDSLYQWDLNQILEIRGLSLSATPEIHFTNGLTNIALISETSVDDVGVITAAIPNSLLQSASKITAYVCVRENESFKSLYSVTIPVKARTKPADYVYTETEILSYRTLETRVTKIEEEGLSDERFFDVIDTYFTEEKKAAMAQETIEALPIEEWVFTLEDGSTVTKKVAVIV